MTARAKSKEATMNRETQIQAFKKYWKNLFIITDGLQRGSIIAKAVSKNKESDALRYINSSSQNDIKPVSEAKLQNPMEFQSVKMEELLPYFSNEVNKQNKIVKNEHVLLEEHGYDITLDYYLAIPYPNNTNPDGLVFLFIKHFEKEHFENELSSICKKVVEVFSSKEL